MFVYKSNIGLVREKNEDQAFVITNSDNDIFMMVFDGMGGHKNGDKASCFAKEYMVNAFNKKKKFVSRFDMKLWLKKLVKSTNKFLLKYSKNNNLKGMGTTFSCYLIHKQFTLMCYIGDTRCYLVKDNVLIQKSNDETYVNYLFETGKITKDELATHPHKNIITNALGCYLNLIVNLKFINDNYDSLLICSDGLYNMVSDSLISEIIMHNNSDLDSCADELIGMANKMGGRDNISIALYVKEK